MVSEFEWTEIEGRESCRSCSYCFGEFEGY